MKQDEVVAFIGDETLVTEMDRGHFESLLTVAFSNRKPRFRNFAWEADTVWEQPRDANFPTPFEQLEKCRATTIVAQFGRNESIEGAARLPDFIAGYEALCSRLGKIAPRLVLLTPIPFEKPADVTAKDWSARNTQVRLYAQAIVAMAHRNGYTCADLYGDLENRPTAVRLTIDGIHLTPAGSGYVAMAAARALGLDPMAARAGTVGSDGTWSNPRIEALRSAIVSKNRFWLSYARPTNWAFLGGERMGVASSFDPNSTHRWFPVEMQEYLSLMQQAEQHIDSLATEAAK